MVQAVLDRMQRSLQTNNAFHNNMEVFCSAGLPSCEISLETVSTDAQSALPLAWINLEMSSHWSDQAPAENQGEFDSLN